MSQLRVFFAIMLPKPIQESISNSLEDLKLVLPDSLIRWVPKDNLHITLQFIKSLPRDALSSLIENTLLELKKTPAFSLELGQLEWFPSQREPKILSLSAGPKSLLEEFSKSIAKTMYALKLPVEERPFRGHLTLGRLLQYEKSLALEELKFPSFPPILIQEIHLMQSQPTKEGSCYSSLAKFTLLCAGQF